MIRLRLAILAVTSLVLAALALGVFTPSAGAVPGQCVTGPFAGFCDEPIQRDGTYLHCESAGWRWFESSNCYRVCYRTGAIMPVMMDATVNETPC